MHTPLLRRLFVALALLVALPAQAVVVGGWDASRGGVGSIETGSFFFALRNEISSNFPGSTFTGSSVLDGAYLSTIDVLLISSATDAVTPISPPLSPAEQAALLAFVQNGGAALLLTDNDTFGGGPSDAANESLLDPFGLDATGTLSGSFNVTVTAPAAHPVTNGPFGLVTSYLTTVPGWFDGLGTSTPLATLDNNTQVALAVIDPGELGSGSGGVLFISDTVFPNTLVHNAIAYLPGAGPAAIPMLTPLSWLILAALMTASAVVVLRPSERSGRPIIPPS